MENMENAKFYHLFFFLFLFLSVTVTLTEC